MLMNRKRTALALLAFFVMITIVLLDPHHTANASSQGELAFDYSGRFTVNETEGTVSLTVIRTMGSAGAVTIDYYTRDKENVPASHPARPGQDFEAVSGTLVFADGESAKTIVVPLINDSLYEEYPESFVIELKNPTGGATLSKTSYFCGVTIISDDDPNSTNVIRAEKMINGEGDGYARVRLTRKNPTNDEVLIHYQTSPGTAQSPSDYDEAAGVIAFAPGETVKVLTIPVHDDNYAEEAEYFFVAFQNVSEENVYVNLLDPDTRISYVDNDRAYVRFKDPVVYAMEETRGAYIKVTRTGERPITVEYETIAGTAAAGTDFTAARKTLSFTKGEVSKTIFVPLLDDSLAEYMESFTIRLFDPIGGVIIETETIEVHILDKDHLT
ncbi:Calx-beta domain-containing protein [Paenibacillus solisilvae]|uniref:Calx-beta domain-containing protein n=1 Tax=Paenibacillus solisilvae TaxID=2486751 RepID=A0ABW0VWZ5_9BACL